MKKDGIEFCKKEKEMHWCVELRIRSETQRGDCGDMVKCETKVFDQKILLNHCNEIRNKVSWKGNVRSWMKLERKLLLTQRPNAHPSAHFGVNQIIRKDQNFPIHQNGDANKN